MVSGEQLLPLSRMSIQYLDSQRASPCPCLFFPCRIDRTIPYTERPAETFYHPISLTAHQGPPGFPGIGPRSFSVLQAAPGCGSALRTGIARPPCTTANQDEPCKHDRGEGPQGVYQAKTRKGVPRKLTDGNIGWVENLHHCHRVLDAHRDPYFLDGSLGPRHGE